MREPVTLRPDAPGVRVDIDENLIRAVVLAFYARIRADDSLGPIFNGAITDWPAHLNKLCAFWSSVTLMSGAYKGQPLQVHMQLPDLGDDHFHRWLSLFRETLDDLCTAPQRDVLMSRAERIADSFRFGIAMAHGRIETPLQAGESGH